MRTAFFYLEPLLGTNPLNCLKTGTKYASGFVPGGSNPRAGTNPLLHRCHSPNFWNPRSNFDSSRPVAIELPGPIGGALLFWTPLAVFRLRFYAKNGLLWSSEGDRQCFCLLASKANSPTLFHHMKLLSYMTKTLIHIR